MGTLRMDTMADAVRVLVAVTQCGVLTLLWMKTHGAADGLYHHKSSGQNKV